MMKVKKIIVAICLTLIMALGIPAFLPGMDGQILTVEAASKVKLNKTKETLIKGETLQLKITGTSKQVKWSTSKKSIATVNAKGKVTAKKKGNVIITAKVGNKKYKCKITVETPKINKTAISLKTAQTYTLKISGTSQKVLWSSSNKKVATVNGKGIVKALNNGYTTITAKIGKKNYKCKVTVTKAIQQIPISSFKLDKTNATLIIEHKNSVFDSERENNRNYASSNAENADNKGVGANSMTMDYFYNKLSNKELNLRAIGYPANTTENKTITWASSNTAIATVDENGGVTPVSVGTCTITANCGSHSADCMVTVGADNLANIVNNDSEWQNYLVSYDKVESHEEKVTYDGGYTYHTEKIIDSISSNTITFRYKQDYDTELIKRDNQWWLGVAVTQTMEIVDVNMQYPDIPIDSGSDWDGYHILNVKRRIYRDILHRGYGCNGETERCKAEHTLESIKIGDTVSKTFIEYIPFNVNKSYDITANKYDCTKAE